MRLDKERLEAIKTMILTDQDGVSLIEKGQKEGEGEYYISYDVFAYVKGEEVFDRMSLDQIADAMKDKEYTAEIFLGWEMGKEAKEKIKEWEDLAKYLGISEMVTVATKIPKVVARRFEYFANQGSNKSDTLRKLVYAEVKKNMVDQVDRLMFRENIFPS